MRGYAGRWDDFNFLYLFDGVTPVVGAAFLHPRGSWICDSVSLGHKSDFKGLI